MTWSTEWLIDSPPDAPPHRSERLHRAARAAGRQTRTDARRAIPRALAEDDRLHRLRCVAPPPGHALASPARLAVLREMLPTLVSAAAAVLPDRLAGIPGLGTRAVRAIDGTYQSESAHVRRRTPKQGGEDKP